MSLINDALRRANTQRPSDAQSSAPIPAMQPVELAPSSSSRVLPFAVLIAGVGVLAIAAVLFFRGRTPETRQLAQNDSAAAPAAVPASQTIAETPVATAPESIVQPQPQVLADAPTPEPVKTVVAPTTTPPPVQKSSPAIAVASAPTQPSIPQTPPAETKPAEVTVATANPAPIQTKAPAVSESHEARPPRLQAIYYRLRKPTVLINGKTLGPGDSVDGIKIVSIQRSSVEVVQNGKYRTLTMQD